MVLRDEILQALREADEPLSGFQIGRAIEATRPRRHFLFWSWAPIVPWSSLHYELDKLERAGTVLSVLRDTIAVSVPRRRVYWLRNRIYESPITEADPVTMAQPTPAARMAGMPGVLDDKAMMARVDLKERVAQKRRERESPTSNVSVHDRLEQYEAALSLLKDAGAKGPIDGRWAYGLASAALGRVIV